MRVCVTVEAGTEEILRCAARLDTVFFLRKVKKTVTFRQSGKYVKGIKKSGGEGIKGDGGAIQLPGPSPVVSFLSFGTRKKKKKKERHDSRPISFFRLLSALLSLSFPEQHASELTLRTMEERSKNRNRDPPPSTPTLPPMRARVLDL